MFSMQPDLGLVWKFKNIEVFHEFHVKNIQPTAHPGNNNTLQPKGAEG